MTSRPAAGGGRWVAVAPVRLARWLDGFAERHGPTPSPAYDGTSATFNAADGAVAEVEVPFPPLAGDLLEHVLRPRVVGVLLVRRGGHAAGVFEDRRLVSSKVGSRHVQGRTAAGGWSQQRFARRRDNQADAAVQAAADVAARVLLERPLDGVVVGGDRASVDAVLADRRLLPLRPLVTGRLLDVPDPRL
ncbi:MAG: acVLRF1 family peptidyl-tRNA hydrolase, partial [Mycobacteriales bacterium]